MTDLDQELSALEDSLGGGASDTDAQAIEAIAMAAKKAQEEYEEAPFEVPKQETSAQQTKRWTKYAKEHLKGRTIKDVRYMTPSELSDLGWYSRPIVLVLDNGTLLYPSQDDEGNGAGSLFGNTDGRNTSGITDALTFPVLRR